MYHIQTSLFYDLQELVRNSSLLRKYYYLFKALDLSILPDRNHGVGRTGHSQHAMLQAFIVKLSNKSNLSRNSSTISKRYRRFWNCAVLRSAICPMNPSSIDSRQIPIMPSSRIFITDSISALSNRDWSALIHLSSTQNPLWLPPKKTTSKILLVTPPIKQKNQYGIPPRR